MLPERDIERIADATLRVFEGYDARLRATAAAEVLALEATDVARLRSRLEKLSQASKADIERAVSETMAQAARKSLAGDEARYEAARLAGVVAPYAPLAESAAFGTLLERGILTARSMTNLVRTSAEQSVYSEFTAALDSAMVGVASGTVSHDAAVRAAVKRIATFTPRVTYRTPDGGYIERELYGAVQSIVRTSAMQTMDRLTDARIAEVGATFVEVSAHLGARPEHAAWQGQVYAYPGEFEAATDAGSVTGFGGANCRHFKMPYFPGINEPGDWGFAEDPDGEQYALSQRQRESERNIREYKARQAGYAGVKKETDDKAIKTWAESERAKAQALKEKWQAEADRVVSLRDGARRGAREVGAPRPR